MAKRKEPTTKEILAQLNERYARWEYLYQNGGSDPFYPDGENLNLVRNHIIYFKRQLEELQNQQREEQISLFESDPVTDTRPLPPKVDDGYMARSEQIRSDGLQTLRLLQADPDAQYVLHPPRISEAAAKKMSLSAYLHYYHTLKHGLETDNLVDVRRYRNAEYWLECFREKAAEIRKIVEKESEESAHLGSYSAASGAGFACSFCGEPISKGSPCASCPDCGVIFCTDCWENGTWQSHACDEEEEDFCDYQDI